MAGIKREDTCLGFITGECRNTDTSKGCNEMNSRDCYAPVCQYRTRLRSCKAYCKATGKEVDMWDVCRKCNPSNELWLKIKATITWSPVLFFKHFL